MRPKIVAETGDRSPGESAGSRASQYLLQMVALADIVTAGVEGAGAGGGAPAGMEIAVKRTETIPTIMSSPWGGRKRAFSRK
ncbi:hypothetical protein GCM10022235_76290 [Kribbella ginsengisoli]|uniref:Uncharacterized protein n=1 Tax=Kribbella ginsengisoli TaxID=363865 RepID=A0ABP6YYJ3_9ACTN